MPTFVLSLRHQPNTLMPVKDKKRLILPAIYLLTGTVCSQIIMSKEDGNLLVRIVIIGSVMLILSATERLLRFLFGRKK